MTVTANPFTQGQTLWSEHEAYIHKMARSYSYSYAHVEAEDLLQEVHLFLWEKEPAFLAQRRNQAYVRTCIHNVCKNYALRVRNTHLLVSDRFYYSVDEVKTLLPAYFAGYESWAASPVPEGAQTTTKNDNVEIFCDISLAMKSMVDSQVDVLRKKYADDEDLDASDRKTLSRAVQRLTSLLNGNKNREAREHVGPGSRKATTNAAAQFKTKHYED